MNFSPDDLPESPTSAEKSADAASRSADGLPSVQPADFVPTSPDPAWDGWDVLRIIFITIVALFASVFTVLFLARWWVYPHMRVVEIARVPLVVVAGQALAYLFILAYMYVLVTREHRRPDFFAAIHWNWPSNVAVCVLTGFVLSVVLQLLSHLLPIPKELPIDSFFRTPAEAWAIGILSITLAPLMEELFFAAFSIPCSRAASACRLPSF